MDEPRFLGTGDDARTDAGLPLDAGEELAAVAASRVALVAAARISSTPCDSASRLNFESACSAAVIASVVSALPSRPPAPSRTIDLLPVDDFERQVRSHPDDDHVNRVGADVDGRDAHVRSSLLALVKPSA